MHSQVVGVQLPLTYCAGTSTTSSIHTAWSGATTVTWRFAYGELPLWRPTAIGCCSRSLPSLSSSRAVNAPAIGPWVRSQPETV